MGKNKRAPICRWIKAIVSDTFKNKEPYMKINNRRTKLNIYHKKDSLKIHNQEKTAFLNNTLMELCKHVLSSLKFWLRSHFLDHSKPLYFPLENSKSKLKAMRDLRQSLRIIESKFINGGSKRIRNFVFLPLTKLANICQILNTILYDLSKYCVVKKNIQWDTEIFSAQSNLK